VPQPKRICIFYQPGCGRVTKEDVWPTWLSKYIPRDLRTYSTMSAVVHHTHADVLRENVHGDPRSRRVKWVCGSCNNGWMSTLQKLAKPILLPLMSGETTILSKNQQEIIAAWCAMSAMTSDYFYPEKQAIPQTHRDYLRANRLPPPDTWKIWIGRYERQKWVGQWVKNSLAITSEEHVAQFTPQGFPRPNTQTTTLVFGQLYVHVFSSVHPDIVAKATIAGKGIEKIAQIWPVREQFIAWPTNALLDRDADRIAGAIFGILDRLGRADNQG
jgi:hypothetical protein